MPNPWTLTVPILAAAAGMVTGMAASRRIRAGGSRFFRYLAGNILLFNLLILADIAFRILPLDTGSTRVFLFFLAGIKLSWLGVFFLMNQAIASENDAGSGAGRIARITACAWLVCILAGSGFWLLGKPAWVDGTIFSLEVLVLAGAALSAGTTWIRAFRLSERPLRKAVGLFAGFHTAVLLVILISLGPGSGDPAGGGGHVVTFRAALLALYNLFPLAWLQWTRYGSREHSIHDDRFGLTAREREISKLIGAGLTNQEIADRLFISLATVKDHNYNIFRKTGVRNRVELVNLLRPAGE